MSHILIYFVLAWSQTAYKTAEGLLNFCWLAPGHTRKSGVPKQSMFSTIKDLKIFLRSLLSQRESITRSERSARPAFGQLIDTTLCLCEDNCSDGCVNAISRVECTDSICRNPNCFNRSMQKAVYTNCIVCDESGKGKGVKADEAIIKGQFVTEYMVS
jgi:hypothetical protein